MKKECGILKNRFTTTHIPGGRQWEKRSSQSLIRRLDASTDRTGFHKVLDILVTSRGKKGTLESCGYLDDQRAWSPVKQLHPWFCWYKSFPRWDRVLNRGKSNNLGRRNYKLCFHGGPWILSVKWAWKDIRPRIGLPWFEGDVKVKTWEEQQPASLSRI